MKRTSMNVHRIHANEENVLISSTDTNVTAHPASVALNVILTHAKAPIPVCKLLFSYIALSQCGLAEISQYFAWI